MIVCGIGREGGCGQLKGLVFDLTYLEVGRACWEFGSDLAPCLVVHCAVLVFVWNKDTEALLLCWL
jgi:hypothetical protein